MMFPPAAIAVAPRHASNLRRRVALVGGLHVGVETVFENVRRAAAAERDLETVPIPIPSFAPDRFERFLGFLPRSTRGNLRYVAGSRALSRSGRLDAVWTLLDIPLLPWMVLGNRRPRVPVIFSTDSTPRQLRSFGQHYGNWGGSSPTKFRVREAIYRRFCRRVTAVQAYTEWAAASLRRDYDVPGERIRVFPPGIDIETWIPGAPRERERLPRLLFVGGDFARKGGDLLLQVFRANLRGRAEMDMVTRSGAAETEPGVRVHAGLRPNDPALVHLYQNADVLVIPTRADCFSIAGLEAMACGVPVIICPVGGVAELFTDGHEGVYVPVDDARALSNAIISLLGDPPRRWRMGRAARELAVARYDARRNTKRLLNLVGEVPPG